MATQVTPVDAEGVGHPTGHPDEPEKVRGKSPLQLARARFRKDKTAMAALFIVIFYTVAALAAPILVQVGVLDPYSSSQELTGPDQLPIGRWWGISWDHPLGVEPGIGRDVLSRIWYGVTFSLVIALSAALITIVIGVVLGIIAGLSGGWLDTIIGRLIDLTLSFPQTLMLLAMSSVALAFITGPLGIPEGNLARSFYVITVLGLFAWPTVARLVRGQVLSLREREFVHAARLLGASPWRMYFKEILPNLWAPILVSFTLLMPLFVSAEAALAYLNVSVQEPTPTLGSTLTKSLQYAGNDFLFFFAPAFLIAVIVVSFNLLGDGLRDALDPKSSQ